MKKAGTTFSLIFLFAFWLQADVPGKREMKESKLTLQGVNSLSDYNFYFNTNFDYLTRSLATDSTITILPSGGAPDGVHLWGINKKTKRSTDTLNFYNHYSPDAVIVFEKVLNDSIRYRQVDLSNNNAITEGSDTDSINNRQLIADANEVKKNHLTKIILFSLAGILSLAALVWIFIRKKKERLQ